MKTYKQLTYSDMVKIETFIAEGYKAGEIAIKIGKNATTIYRCMKNNSDDNGIFVADEVWEKVSERKSNANKHIRIIPDSLLEKYILVKIEEHWSPEQIAGTWADEKKESICHETIYQYVYKYRPHLVKMFFRRKGKKYKHERKSKYQIPDRRMIDERPKEVENRKEVGHWEGDTIVGKDHKGSIVTNVERKSGKLIASKTKDRTAEAIFEATVEDFKNIPDQLHISITYDNGREFSAHKKIENTIKMTVYFAHAYSPWERGSNENTNGLLREFIPKGTDFDTVSKEDLAYYVDLINNRPRKRLGFKTPNEVFQEELEKVALDSRM